MPDIIEVKPVLKARDSHVPTSFIYFDEWVEIPGYGTAEISLHFDEGNSFEEMRSLARTLRAKGFRMVIKRPRGSTIEDASDRVGNGGI